MRNIFSAVVNWCTALFASATGAPHAIVATDGVEPSPSPAAEQPRTASSAPSPARPEPAPER
ncbi:hypothetical protein [Agrococcus carbonis]|uniref:hypothetical protein n=1 Tax=Agrococcus carbonis TaxID=684552 RepID=UPI0012FAE936|nr:hypothetical protein [Agrococcus carbonis]